MFSVTAGGSFDKTEAFLKKASSGTIWSTLGRFGQEGVTALARATPKESGLTASSWYYEVLQNGGSWSIVWGNTNVVDGTPVAILLQLGHGTGTGGYVEGYDFINPALRPVFDKIADDAWKAVTTA